MDIHDTRARLKPLQHLLTALGWLGLLLYSVYLLLDGFSGGRELSILHLLIPVVLLLVTIRAARRYLWYRAAARG